MQQRRVDGVLVKEVLGQITMKQAKETAYERWKGIEQDTDLKVLAVELERLRTEYRKVASSREDDKQVALLGNAAEEAEKGNGGGLATILSKAGTGVLKVAKDIGTDVAAKVIVELMKAG